MPGQNSFAGVTLALGDMMANAASSRSAPEAESRAMIGCMLAGQGAICTVERAMEVAGGSSSCRGTGRERAFREAPGVPFRPQQEKPQRRDAGCLELGRDRDGPVA